MKANLLVRTSSDVRVEQVPDPKILNPRDAIVRITSTAICGSDLHLYNGFIPTMETGDILGHEFMGEVVEVGRGGREPRRSATASSSRSRSPAAAASSASGELFSLCENSNPNAWMAEKMWGHSPGRHLRLLAHAGRLRGRAGASTRACRSPTSGRSRSPTASPDEQVLFLSDIFPTGYMAAENCDIQPGDTVAVWGCGPVGQFAIQSAYLLGAERVIAIDRFPERLRMARERAGAETINYEEVERLRGAAGDDRRPRPGRAASTPSAWRRTRPGPSVRVRPREAGDDARDRPADRAARRRSWPCRNGGTVSVAGVYGGFIDKFPFGVGHEPVAHDQDGPDATCSATCGRCSSASQKGEIDPSFVITHRLPLEPGAARLRDLQRQGGRLHQGRPPALSPADLPGRAPLV